MHTLYPSIITNMNSDRETSDPEKLYISASNAARRRRTARNVGRMFKSHNDKVSRNARPQYSDDSDPEKWRSIALGMQSEDEDEEPEYQIFRTRGDWYRVAHRELKKFTDDLKRRTMSKKVPINIAHRLFPTVASRAAFGMSAPTNTYQAMPVMLAELNQMDAYIKSELRDRLTKMRVQYLENDPYENVAKYITFKEITDLNKIYPWLGTTDYNSNSGGHAMQRMNLISKLEKLHKKVTVRQLHGGTRRANLKSQKMRRRTLRK